MPSAITASTPHAHLQHSVMHLAQEPPAYPAWEAALPSPLAVSALKARLLGGFSLRQADGAPLPLPPGRARTLLKLLLLRRRRALSRSRLCTLLWPHSDGDNARNCLNVLLHRLRRALGRAAGVRCSAEGYQFVAPGELWLDSEEFVRLADLGRRDEAAGHRTEACVHYEAALSLYRSDLLDSGEPDAALAGDDQLLRDRCSEALECLAMLRERAGDWHGCLRSSQRHLEIDNSNEQVHQRLMRCYARLGQVQLAERQYRRCVQVLHEQFAAAPCEETTSLYRRIAARQAA